MGRKGTARDKQVSLRFNAVIVEHLQRQAAALGLTTTEYIRVMVCLDVPYLLLASDAARILGGADDIKNAVALTQSALAYLDEREPALLAMVERITATLPVAQQANRHALIDLRTTLQDRLNELGQWSGALQTLRKRLEERQGRRSQEEGTP
jgi:hypothetical protein